MRKEKSKGIIPAQRACDACGSANFELFSTDESHAAIKCKACGLVQTHPIPNLDDLKRFYDGFAFLPPVKEKIATDLQSIRESLEYHIGARGSRSDFLDYGGGYGLYAKAAGETGWRVSLFDYDPGALNFAKDELGVERCVESTEELPSNSFDVIWSFHVIEHLMNVKETFSEIDRLLRPGGMVVFATPNARSWEKYFRLSHFRNYWNAWRKRGLGRLESLFLLLRYDSFFCWDPPRHLYAFTPESLRRLGEHFGYQTDIRVGSNLDPRFEPRRYVMGNAVERKRLLIRQLWRRPWRPGIWLALIRTVFELIGFRLAARLAPEGGEQLYAILKKPA